MSVTRCAAALRAQAKGADALAVQAELDEAWANADATILMAVRPGASPNAEQR